MRQDKREKKQKTDAEQGHLHAETRLRGVVALHARGQALQANLVAQTRHVGGGVRVALLLRSHVVGGELRDVLRQIALDARGRVAGGEVLEVGLQRVGAADGFVDVVELEGERGMRLHERQHRLDQLEHAAPVLRRERTASRRAAQLRDDAVREHAQLVFHAQLDGEGKQLAEVLQHQRRA